MTARTYKAGDAPFSPKEGGELLALIEKALAPARRRLNMIRAQHAEAVVNLVHCRLCFADAGSSCMKPSGGRCRPHAERIADARAMMPKAAST